MKSLRIAIAALLLPVFAMACGCHSAHVAVTVENRTGAPIDLLEVDYPSASFGADSVANGADFHYLIQVRLSGPIKVQYTESTSHRVRQLTGPDLFEGQQGKLQIVLQPDGTAKFQPELNPAQ